MKMRKLKRFVSFVLIVNLLTTIPFVVGAAPLQTSNKHYRSYSESGKSKMSLDEITDNKKFEEYRKKGYEDGFNNVLVKPFVPKRYRAAYEEEYKRGQEEYRKKVQEEEKKTDKSDDKSEKNKEQENATNNKVHNDVNSKEKEMFNKRVEEYKKKGYEDGFNNVEIKKYVPREYRKAYEEEYKRGQEEYRKKAIGKFGYEDGIKNGNFMENLKKFPKSYKLIYESEYIKGLLIYIKKHLNSLIIEFGKELPKTEQQAKELGILHGLNNDQYRIGASEDIQNEYSKAYFFAQKIRLKNQGYRDAIKNTNKKTLKKH